MTPSRVRDFFAASSFSPGAAAARSLTGWGSLAALGALVGEDGLQEASLGRLGSLEVRLARRRKEVRRAQRVRYKVFFEERGMAAGAVSTLQRRDICPFDQVCDHLVVIDHAHVGRRSGLPRPRVVGTYRLLRQSVAESRFGFYTQREFDMSGLLARHRGKVFLELGRSCVLPDYRSKRTIELLWRGIAAYVERHRVDVLFGCASFDGVDPAALALGLSFLRLHARAAAEWQAPPRTGTADAAPLLPEAAVDRRAALASLPPLIKGYLRAGARFGDGIVRDEAFGTTDVLAILPMAELDRRYMAHFGSA